MESFSLLKFWRGGAAEGDAATAATASADGNACATAIAASVCDDGGGGGDDDDASFFDLEFAVPADAESHEDAAASDADEERVEFDFAAAGDGIRPEPLSPSDDLFFKGKHAAAAAAADSDAEAGDVTAPASQVPSASFLRSATKFRVLLLKLRKARPSPSDSVAAASAGGGIGGASSPKPAGKFLIKLKVDDAPIISLFTRDTSSRIPAASKSGPPTPPPPATESSAVTAITAEEKRFAKEVVLKYLNKIKPLYVRVSRRYGERLRFSASEGEETDAEPESPAAPPPAPVVVACGVRAPRAGVPAGLKQVCKRLGKSRSASAAVAAAPPPPPSTAAAPQPPQRRDDSLLQLQDGIQSAIAHCKRSFNASKGSESPLLRSMSDPRDARLEKKCNGNGNGNGDDDGNGGECA